MKSKIKLLLNAEPFGFGPSAAIASFFPHLREKFDFIGYVGSDHTLDLQTRLPYNEIHNLNEARNKKIYLQEIIPKYDLVLTASDFSFSEIACSLQIDTIIYDPLTWYWRSIPKEISRSQLYIAQNFFGVEYRLLMDSNAPKNYKVVSPFILIGFFT